MKKFICQLHNNPYSLVRISVDQAKLICEECFMNCLENNDKTGVQNVIYLKKSLNSPLYFLSKTNLLITFRSQFEYLQKIDNHEFVKQQELLEEKIRSLLQQLEFTARSMKEYVKLAIKKKDKVIEELKLAIKYEIFESLVNNLEKQNENVNPDIIQQIESQFYSYFASITDKQNEGLTNQIKSIFQKYYAQQSSTEVSKQIQQLVNTKNELNNQYVAFCDETIPKYEFNIHTQFQESKILSNEFKQKLDHLIEKQSKKQIIEKILIFTGSRDGLNSEGFWDKVEGKTNLLMIFKSKKNNSIFGGYSPCEWQPYSKWVRDDTLCSFLFSYTRNEIYPIKVGEEGTAIYCDRALGPCFGGGREIHIASDFQDGYSNFTGIYYSTEQYTFEENHLFGANKPNISECEIYQLIFD